MTNFRPVPAPAANLDLIGQLAKYGAGDYLVTGDATHYAETSDEIMMVYPAGDHFLILTFDMETAGEYVGTHRDQENAKDEDAEEAAIAVRMDLPAPSEQEVEADEMADADNGDGTLTFRTRRSFF